MAGIFSGLESLGLGNLTGAKLFEKEEKSNEAAAASAAPVLPQEKDYIFDKTMVCPICGEKFTTKIMKSSKAKLLSSDLDLRQKFEGVDAVKYDAVRCNCGYSALSRYFTNVTPSQAKAIKDNICSRVKITENKGEIYTYEEAIERYKLALACAVVKQAKASEKGYICLKSAWLLRGYQEHLQEKGELTKEKKEALATEEKDYLKNAFEGFAVARSGEGFPIAGMDESTVDYLLTALAYEIGSYEIASKLVAKILTANVSSRMKDKARDLKDLIMVELKKEAK